MPEQEQGGSITKLVTGIHTGLLKLAEVLQGSGLPPEIAQQAGALVQQYQGLIEAVGQASGQQPQQQGQAAPQQAQPQAAPQGPIDAVTGGRAGATPVL